MYNKKINKISYTNDELIDKEKQLHCNIYLTNHIFECMNIYIFFSMKYCEFWKKLMAFDSLAHICIIANVRKKNMKQISSE